MSLSSQPGIEFVQNTGFTPLYKPETKIEPIVDIVFVHGLQGHPRNTWTWKGDIVRPVNAVPIHEEPKRNRLIGWMDKLKKGDDLSTTAKSSTQSAVFWPYDLLPEDCPNSRILTWGYESKVSNFFSNSASKNTVLSHSRDLLGDLYRERGPNINRPIIFVAHSLGGIIVKQMLLHANRSNDGNYRGLCKSTKAVFFLGTPHTGSEFANLGDALSRVVRAIGFDTANQNLIALKPDSVLLDQCREDFFQLYSQEKFEVYTFQEARGMKGIGFARFNDKVVPDASFEFMGSQKRFTIDANHREMCRFSSKDDDGYRKVGRELQLLCQAQHDQNPGETNRQESTGREISCLHWLAFQEINFREQKIVDARDDTCAWLFDHSIYKEWTKNSRGLLGIRGKPGSGKSTVMKKIFHSLKENTSQNHVQLAFFFHRRGSSLQQSQLGMFQSLLHQLLSRVPSVKTDFWELCDQKTRWQGDSGKDWDWRIEELRQIFSSSLLAAATEHPISIFLDALDEAGNEAAQDVISYLYEISEKLLKIDATTSICFSCRHYPILEIKGGSEICLEDNNKIAISKYTLTELEKRLLTDKGVAYREEFLKSMQLEIIERAAGVFLWVALIVPMVAKQYNNGRSLDEIHKKLHEVPSNLGEVYKHILTQVVDVDDRPQTLHLMQWIFLAVDPLSVAQLRSAMAMDQPSTTLSPNFCKDGNDFVEDDLRTEKLILSLSGGLAEVINHEPSSTMDPTDAKNTVQFIHQSVNDFIRDDRFRCLQVDVQKDLTALGHHRLARSCINCLRLGQLHNMARRINDFPFTRYAAEFWYIHAEKAEKHGISQKDLLELFEYPSQILLDYWVQVLGDDSSLIFLEGTNLIHVAAASNLCTLVNALLQAGVRIEEEDELGNRALHYAALGGHKEVIRILLDVNADGVAENKDHMTALDLAVRAEYESVVKLLLEAGVDFISKSKEAGGPLQAAALGGCERLIKLFLEKGVDVNAQGGKYGNALQAAAYHGNEANVQLLLERGADVNAQGGEYGNALQAAAYHGDKAIVELLIKRGADVNAQGGIFGNILQAAALRGSKAIVELSLERGADVNTQGGIFGNALQASAFNDNEAIVELLLERGADVNTQGGHYGSALQQAAYRGNKAIVELLIKRGADVNAQGGEYGNALQAANGFGHRGIVDLLLRHGACKEVDNDGEISTARSSILSI